MLKLVPKRLIAGASILFVLTFSGLALASDELSTTTQTQSAVLMPTVATEIANTGSPFTAPAEPITEPVMEQPIEQPIAPPVETATALVESPAATPTAEPTEAPREIPAPTAPAPNISAGTFVVMERSCQAVLAGQDEGMRRPPASITKIFTALVVADSMSLDDMVVNQVDGPAMKRRGSSTMGLEPGMEISVRDLLYGLILRSGNDAALALADHYPGGREAFVDAMNAKALALGLINTHFENPHGLDSDQHYSSALDMAKAGAALLDNPTLAAISIEPSYAPPSPLPPINNGNKLLKQYAGAYGVKIGYTEGAGQTFVAAAAKDGRDIIVSVFGSSDRYADAAELLDWAFESTSPSCS